MTSLAQADLETKRLPLSIFNYSTASHSSRGEPDQRNESEACKAVWIEPWCADEVEVTLRKAIHNPSAPRGLSGMC